MLLFLQLLQYTAPLICFTIVISYISLRLLTSSSHYLKLGTILGARCLFIYYSAGTKCEVTVLFVCELINFLASFSSNTRSSTLALSFNINCQLRGKVSSCRCKPSISYLSNNVVCSYCYSGKNIVNVLSITAFWKFVPQNRK